MKQYFGGNGLEVIEVLNDRGQVLYRYRFPVGYFYAFPEEQSLTQRVLLLATEVWWDVVQEAWIWQTAA